LPQAVPPSITQNDGKRLQPTVAIDCFRSSRCIAHMGRQFSYFACPEDLAEIQREVFAPMNGRLVIADKRDGSHHLTSAESFSLGVETMGKEALFLLLVPPPPLEKMVFSGPWLDDARSSVIQVGRSYIKDGRIKAARFWYEPGAFENGQARMKPPEFIDWASTVFGRTKKLLVRRTTSCGRREYTDWYGKFAAGAVDQKMLAPVTL